MMRSSLILGVALLLTIATTSIVQACKSEHTCGNLGPGTNACKCGEIVVKAAKVQKPLFYASPRAINEAAAAREAVGRVNVGSEYGTSFPKYSSSGTFGSSGSSMFSSSSSSVGILGGSFGRSNAVAYSPFKSVSGKVTSSCGCGKTSESLEARDLLSSNIEGKIVPSFPPIGDLCYPSPPNGKFQVTTKVTPAHPGKIKCGPPIPYEICVKVLNGQIDEAGLRELGLATGGSYGSQVAFAGGNSLGAEYTTSNDVATRYGSYGSYGSYGGGASASASASSTTRGYAGGSLAGYESYADAAAGSTASYGYGSYADRVGTASAGAGSSDFEAVQGASSCDFGDDAELLEDYSYPRLPADPVSLTLAYKNLFPRTVHYNSRKAFVPEDKLAFGHRTMPTESTPGKKMSDVPEEKLQILEKPVVELKPVQSVPTTIGAYDEQEEAKLAELEAIERERINREELAERQRGNFITYGDLGYAPINRGSRLQPLSAGPIGVLNAEDDIGADCGPVGPPDPDYVPGSVLIDRDFVENQGKEIEDDVSTNIGDSELYVRHYAGGDISEEEDDSDDSTSGIFARLKSVARKYGSPCAGSVV